jgi:hypothetical protein
MFLPVFGERLEKHIDGKMLAAALDSRSKLQHAVLHTHVAIGRNDVDLAGPNPHSILDFIHVQPAYPRKDFGREAAVLWIQMLNDNESSSNSRRKIPEKLRYGRQSAGRRTDANNRK